MFTGIVQGTGIIVDIIKTNDHKAQTNWVKLPQICLDNLQIGASIANNGCCLTIAEIKGDTVAFNLIAETLERTNLSSLKIGDEVNLERSLKMGDEIGGHLLSGHIMQTIDISRIESSENNLVVYFNFPDHLKQYILTKGFIGLDGCSLTVGEVTKNEFCVHLIPETINLTIFKSRKVGDFINLEIDSQTQAIVDTVTRILHEQIILPI